MTRKVDGWTDVNSNDIDADATVTVSGTVTITWANLGDQ